MNKTLVIIVVIALLGIVGFGLVKAGVFKPKVKTGGDTFIVNGIQLIQQMDLLTYSIEDIMMLNKNNDPKKKLDAVILVPVKLDAYIDLSKIVPVGGDSITKLLIPHAAFRNISFDIADTTQTIKVIDINTHFIHIGKRKNPGNYIDNFIDKYRHDADSIKNDAIKNHMLDKADSAARTYISNVCKTLMHRTVQIEFTP